MSEGQLKAAEQKGRVRKKGTEKPEGSQPKGAELPAISRLQQQVGNQAVQRLVRRKGGDGGFKLDEETTAAINRERGGGQALDSNVQQEIGGALGADFSGVRVHTSSESDELNRALGARAFTTGQDVFFREGEYSPESSSGKELITHELSHVVQQGSGQVRGDGSGDMAVGAPGDQFEHEADAAAKSVAEGAGAEAAAGDTAQRQPLEEEEEMAQARSDDGADLQRQELPEEEMAQMQDIPDEEEVAQAQELPEEEEEAAQMQEVPEEEEEEPAQT